VTLILHRNRSGMATVPRRGLTFFEVTVVFVVIAILVAVIFFGTRRLTVETQLARVHEEHRVISRALQNYYVDYSDFPTQGQGLVVLSEPVTYLASLPRDIFARGVSAETYAYRTAQVGIQTVWVLVSRGPDGDMDLDAGQPRQVPPGSSGSAPSEDLPLKLLLGSYNPTNGLHSDGDVYTLAPFALN
jgi:type II secretory pathway pseudopilin PulG